MDSEMTYYPFLILFLPGEKTPLFCPSEKESHKSFFGYCVTFLLAGIIAKGYFSSHSKIYLANL